MADTPQVSGKVKAGTLASLVASGVVTWVVTALGDKVPLVHQAFSGTNGALYLGVIVAAVTGLFTFASGYIARHLPAELLSDVESAYNASSATDAAAAAQAQAPAVVAESSDETPAASDASADAPAAQEEPATEAARAAEVDPATVAK